MAEHEASCQCGGLIVRASRDPDMVMACNCTQCQRRTGAPFGAAGYFQQTALDIEGASRVWTRKGTSGKSLELHFCPTCGTTLYWTIEALPGLTGVAYGCFETPLPGPTIAVWAQHKHDWISFPEGCQVFEQSVRR